MLGGRIRGIPYFLWRGWRGGASLSPQGILLGGRLARRRTFGWCSHDTTLTTITAGLAREVCEICGHVRLQYIERAVQIYPTAPRSMEPLRPKVEPEARTGPRTCGLCSQPALFMIPGGMTCEEHAWQAAARTHWDEADPWVPIRIDKSNA